MQYLNRTINSSLSSRTIIFVVSVIIYVVAFVLLFDRGGPSIAALALLPIVVAAWLFAIYVSLLIAILFFPLNLLLFVFVGFDLQASLAQVFDPGSSLFVVMPLLVGGSRWLLLHSYGQAEALRLERAQLQQEIARREIVERALLEAKEVAELATRAKSSFLANMSHELRTPLSVVIGYTELLQDRARAEKHDRYIAISEKTLVAAKQLLQLINDVLDISKIEAEHMQINWQIVDLTQLIEQISIMVYPLVEKNKNEFTVEIAPDLPSLYADPDRVSQILLNLLSNAAKFTHQGQVHLHVYKKTESNEYLSEDRLYISVSDTGIGMPQEILKQIFQPFMQANSSTSRKYGGSGLGLAICYQLAQLMGGQIEVSSEVNKGTNFVVSLLAGNHHKMIRAH